MNAGGQFGIFQTDIIPDRPGYIQGILIAYPVYANQFGGIPVKFQIKVIVHKAVFNRADISQAHHGPPGIGNNRDSSKFSGAVALILCPNQYFTLFIFNRPAGHIDRPALNSP